MAPLVSNRKIKKTISLPLILILSFICPARSGCSIFYFYFDGLRHPLTSEWVTVLKTFFKCKDSLLSLSFSLIISLSLSLSLYLSLFLSLLLSFYISLIHTFKRTYFFSLSLLFCMMTRGGWVAESVDHYSPVRAWVDRCGRVFRGRPVWPDVEIKSGPNFLKFTQKLATVTFAWKVVFF